MSDGGKGSKQRPTDFAKFGANYDAIFRKPEPRVIEEQAAEDEAFEAIARHQTDAINAYNDQRLVSKMDKIQNASES